MHVVADEDREQDREATIAKRDREAIIAGLVPRARAPATPRWLWITALVLGAAGAIAFVVAALRGGDAASSGGPTPASTGSSFPWGLVLGAGIGLAIGWVLGRRAAHASGQSSAHSERNMP